MSALHFGNPRLTLGEKGTPITFGKGGVPAGYSRSKIGGVAVTYLGRPVYDDGYNVIYL